MSQLSSVGALITPGGIPQKDDIAPSFVYLFAYLALFGIIGFRFGSRRFRYHQLIYPLVFVVVRIVSYIIRLVISFRSKNGQTTSRSLYIAEIVLFNAGLPFLVRVCHTTATGRIMNPTKEKSSGYSLFLRVARIFAVSSLALLVAAGVIAVTEFPSTSTVKIMRQVAYYLLIVMSFVSLTIALKAACTHYNNGAGITLPYLLLSAFLNMFCIGISAWHLGQVYSNPGDNINSLTVFYVVPCLLETIAVMWFGILNLKMLFVADAVDVEESKV